MAVVNYVRVHKVSMECVESIDVHNVVWQHPNTVFRQKMSPSHNAFQWYHLAASHISYDTFFAFSSFSSLSVAFPLFIALE